MGLLERILEWIASGGDIKCPNCRQKFNTCPSCGKNRLANMSKTNGSFQCAACNKKFHTVQCPHCRTLVSIN